MPLKEDGKFIKNVLNQESFNKLVLYSKNLFDFKTNKMNFDVNY